VGRRPTPSSEWFLKGPHLISPFTQWAACSPHLLLSDSYNTYTKVKVVSPCEVWCMAWQRSCCTVTWACMRGCKCICLGRCGIYKQLPWVPQCMRRHVRYAGVVQHQCTDARTHSPQDVYMRSCMRSLIISVGRWGWWGSASLRRAFVVGVGFYSDMRKMGVLSEFSLLLTGTGVYLGVYVYIHRHTHTLHMWYSAHMWAQGSG